MCTWNFYQAVTFAKKKSYLFLTLCFISAQLDTFMGKQYVCVDTEKEFYQSLW